MDYVIDFGADADVVVTTSGQADPAGIRRFLNEMVSDGRFRPGSSLLNDHSALDFSGLTPADIRDISDLVSRLDEQHRFGPFAVVVPNTFAFGLARMGQTLLTADVLGRIFYSREDAIEWLREVESDAGGELDD
jgi:hypothetical protein